MQTRRDFLRQTSLATTALLVADHEWFKKKPTIGVQLYTLRGEIQKGLDTVLSRVAGIGFNSVEVFGYGNGKFFGKTPEEFSAMLKKNNLRTPSGHYGVMNFLNKGDEDELKKTVADAAKMGHEYFVIPYLTENMHTSLDDYKKLAAKLNRAAEEAKGAGMKFAYHNHNFEFKDWGEGKTGFDIFAKETDPSLVGFEMDIYWVTRAGLDPIQLIKDHPGRIRMWHVKDMSSRVDPSFTTNGEQYFTEVGKGIINYREIFKHKKESGMDFFYVEQDQVKMDVYESITASYQAVSRIVRA